VADGLHESSVAIIIGRGRANLPALDAYDWGHFQGRLIEWLVAYGKFFRLVYSLGVGTDGRAEEQCTIFGAIPDHQLHPARVKIAEMTELYEQAAILFLVGDMEIIKPRPMGATLTKRPIRDNPQA
jgi:hypothetical protein